MAGVGAYDLKDENQAKAYLDELEKTWLFECFSEKSAEGNVLPNNTYGRQCVPWLFILVLYGYFVYKQKNA